MKTEISSTCFGFRCALKALTDGQKITRCDWTLTSNNNHKFITYEKYLHNDKFPHFEIHIDNEKDIYEFTTDDILSTNWVCIDIINEKI